MISRKMFVIVSSLTIILPCTVNMFFFADSAENGNKRGAPAKNSMKEYAKKTILRPQKAW